VTSLKGKMLFMYTECRTVDLRILIVRVMSLMTSSRSSSDFIVVVHDRLMTSHALRMEERDVINTMINTMINTQGPLRPAIWINKFKAQRVRRGARGGGELVEHHHLEQAFGGRRCRNTTARCKTASREGCASISSKDSSGDSLSAVVEEELELPLVLPLELRDSPGGHRASYSRTRDWRLLPPSSSSSSLKRHHWWNMSLPPFSPPPTHTLHFEPH
jgi:hypothetical protein